MLNEQTTEPPLETLEAVATAEEIMAGGDRGALALRRGELKPLCRRAPPPHAPSSRLALGASPRSGIALLRVAKARRPRAVTTCFPTTSRRSRRPVLSHRLILAPEARSAGLTAEEIVGEAVEQTLSRCSSSNARPLAREMRESPPAPLRRQQARVADACGLSLGARNPEAGQRHWKGH